MEKDDTANVMLSFFLMAKPTTEWEGFVWRNETRPGHRGMVMHAQLDENWRAVAYVDLVDGVPVVGEMRLIPYAPDGSQEWEGQVRELFQRGRESAPLRPSRPLSGRLLARLSPTAALAEGRSRLAENDGSKLISEWLEENGVTRDALDAEPDRPGRRGNPDWFYALVVTAYVGAIKRGSRSPNKDVAEQLNAVMGTRYSARYVRDTIERVRGKFITNAPSRRQAGGQPTARCRSALAAAPADVRAAMGF